MSRKSVSKDDQELNDLLEKQQQLFLRHKEIAEIPKRIAQEQRERESTLPPMAEIADRKRRREHENTLSRGEAKNLLRDQNRSLMLLFMLIAATGTLIWWGFKLMEG